MPALLAVLSRIVLVAAAVLAGCASAPPAAEPVPRGDVAAVQRQLEAFVAREMAAQRIAGLGIALVDGQQIVWAKGFGLADAATGAPAGPQTLYRVGSISKLFTDTAAMQLVAQGRLQLDAPVQQVLPWFRIGSAWPDAGPITLRQLMSHHAGLPRDIAGGMWLQQAPGPKGDFRTMLRGLADEQAAAPPQLAFSYSNVGLDLVGAMVEQAAGRPFEAQLQAAVLDPLGMSGASFSAAPPAVPAMARGHQRGEPKEEPALRDVPAGGLNASVTDLARFAMAQFDGGIALLPPAQRAAMFERQFPGLPLDADFSIGLGWMMTTFGTDTVHGGGPVAHHAGATLYHRAQLMVMPQAGLAVAVASNDAAAGAAVSRIAQRALALLLEAKTGVRQAGATPGFVPALQPWGEAAWSALRRDCAGDYTTLAGNVSFRGDGQRLAAEAFGRTLELREGEQGRFGLGYRFLGLVPVPLGALATMGFECRRVDGRDLLFAVQDGERLLAGERLPPRGVPPEAARWTGRYRLQPLPGEVPTMDPSDPVRVLVADGRLWVEYRLHPAFGGAQLRAPLRMLSDRAVRIVGPLADTGPVATLEAGEGAARRLRFSGWVFERIGD